MIQINIHDVKTHLSKYIKLLISGEEILLCKHNIPIAKIVPISKTASGLKRPIGLAKGEFEVPKSFFDPLPDEILNSFSGEK